MTDSHSHFEPFFNTGDDIRGAYLARLFALFSEDVVRAWTRCPGAAYSDLGRPTLYPPDGSRFHTLDFALQSRATGEVHVTELKCEIQWDKFKHCTLDGIASIAHHAEKPAFKALLAMARDPSAYTVKVAGKPVQVSGAALVWGAATEAGRQVVTEHFGLSPVLSIEEMLSDLTAWRPRRWLEYVAVRRRWTDDLFGYLAMGSPDMSPHPDVTPTFSPQTSR